ncbi:MAG: PQQ-binding-like beta-propeller repeat protein [Verrucomicrobiae bacterium]|nr:PQQ-binding-like beta-propeller repeat protein [Verrucomicrobiae bacterium]
MKILLGVVALAVAANSGTLQDRARRILADAGISGGLVVHVGCGEGRLTAALRGSERFTVHGLDRDAGNVKEARRHIRAVGLYGSVSVEHWRGDELPYGDNLVNLIVADEAGAVTMEEVMRVLVPGGVAFVGGKKIVKPWPKEMDEWTHYLYDSSNNAVSRDTMVAPPGALQWMAEPRWARSHDHLATISAVVTARGRVFYIVDEAPTASVALPPKWFLVARDAFNGMLLWKRPISRWQYHLRGFRAGPPELGRRLVAVGERVYVTLGYGEPVSALDAATGETLRTYSQTTNATEFVWHSGVLFVVAAEGVVGAEEEARLAQAATEKWNFWPVYSLPAPKKRLLAVEADSGRTLWEKSGPGVETLMPTALAVAGDRVFYQTLAEIVCADASTGKELWRVARSLSRRRLSWGAPTLVVSGDVVLSADRGATGEEDWVLVVSSAGGQAPVGEMWALDAKTGRKLWSAPAREGYNSPVDVLVADGLVWSGNIVRANDPGIMQARDLLTGEVRRTRPRDQEFYTIGMGHHRCYRNRATARYLITGRAGAEFIELDTGKAIPHHWIRGTCQYGVMPANGLLYVPPHACACFIQSKLNSFIALAPERRRQSADKLPRKEERLECGPAYEDVRGLTSGTRDAGDWPTYRGDAARSGSTQVAVPTKLAVAWEARVGGKLTAPVVAGGRVFVALAGTHEVCALDADTGRELWRFTAGGRVDSPPTIDEGRVIFGCADGWVYCVGAADGRLVWRLQVAPVDERVVVYGQLESRWPVHGSVLVKDGVVFCAAGRSSFLDGGIYLVRLDSRTGRLLSETRLDDRAASYGLTGHLNDVLSSEGDVIFMRHASFGLDGLPLKQNVPHLHSAAGFLDGDWWHRTYWIYGEMMQSGWGRWAAMGNRGPAGQIMVMDDGAIYGFGRVEYGNGIHPGLNVRYHLVCFDKRATRTGGAAEQGAPAKKRKGKQAVKSEPRAVVRWSVEVPLLVRAMVLAGKTLFIAGPPDGFGLAGFAAAVEGGTGGVLWAVAAGDGSKLAEYPLCAPPVWDGMAAAGGRLYISTLDDRVVCLR